MPAAELRAYLDDPAVAHDRLTARGFLLVAESTYESGTTRVHIHSVFEEYHLVEIKAADEAALGDVMALLDVKRRDVIRSSYEDLATVLTAALRWRRQLTPGLERLVLIDGPSGAGKSTLVAELTAESLTTSYVQRTTSRARRSADSADEYEFISVDEFIQLERAGEFLESREFLFDMRYGLRWGNIARALENDRVGLGVMNLGNIRHVGVVAPEVTTVLVTAPLDTLRRRISARGTHTEEAVAERLGNAATVQALADLYDHVLVNDDGALETTQKALQQILDGVRRRPERG